MWSYDFIEDQTNDGRKICWLNIIDEYGRICLASEPRRSWRNTDVTKLLADLMIMHGTPEYLRSDNGSEFIARKLRAWLAGLGVITTYIEPGSPWENGYCESFSSCMCDEFLNSELFGNMYEAKVLTSRWIRYYNEVRQSTLRSTAIAALKNIGDTNYATGSKNGGRPPVQRNR